MPEVMVGYHPQSVRYSKLNNLIVSTTNSGCHIQDIESDYEAHLNTFGWVMLIERFRWVQYADSFTFTE